MEERFERLREETQSADREGSESGRGTANATTRNTYHYEEYDEFGEDEKEEWYRNGNQGRGGRNGRGRFRGDRVRNERGRGDDVERVDRNIGSIKITMPLFQGKNDAEAYLEWERKVEIIFACHNYSEEKKVKLAAVEFSSYAAIWWDQLLVSRRRAKERPMET